MTATTETKAAKGDVAVKLPDNYLAHPAVAPYTQWLSQWRKAYGEPPKPENFSAAVALNNRAGSGHAFKVALALRPGGIDENVFKALTGHKNAHNCTRDAATAGWALRRCVSNVTTLELTPKGKALVAGKAVDAKPAAKQPAKPGKQGASAPKAKKAAKVAKKPETHVQPAQAQGAPIATVEPVAQPAA